jgi:hypothetical protein
LVPFIEEGVRPGYVLRAAAFEAGTALEVDEPWQLRLLYVEMGSGSIVCRLLGFESGSGEELEGPC